MSSSIERRAGVGGMTVVARRRADISATALVVSGCVLLTLIVELWLGATLPIWKDEAFTLISTSRTVQYAAERALGFEQNAPFYFVALTLLRLINSSVFFARALSAICVAIMLLMGAGLAKRYLPHISAGWYVASIAFNPFVIWAAVELRLYALATLLSAALLLLFFDGFLARDRRRNARIAFGVVGAIALYTQFLFALLIAAMAIALIVIRSWRALRDFIVVGLVLAIILLPLVAVLPSQLSGYRLGFAGSTSILGALKQVGMLAAMNALPTQWLPRHFKAVWLIGAGVAFAVAFFKRERGTGRANIPALVSFAVLGLLALAAYFEKEPLLNRHLAFVFVPISLALVAVLADLPSSARRVALAAWTIVSIASASASLVAMYRPLSKDGDAKRVVAYITQREAGNEPVLVFLADEALPVAYYYRGINKIVPLPATPSTRQYDMREMILHDPVQVTRALHSVPGEHRSAWLISTNHCGEFLGLRFGCDVLEKFVTSKATVRERRVF